MVKYYQEFFAIWHKNAPKIFLLNAAVTAYPCVQNSGCKMSKPLALVLGNEYIVSDIVQEISGFNEAKVIPLDLPQRKFEMEMENAEYEVMPILCGNRTDRCCDNLVALSNAMVSGEVNGKPFCVLPIVIFLDGIPNEFTSLLSGKIYIEGKQKIGGCASNEMKVRKLIESLIEIMPIIKHKIAQEIVGNAIPFIGLMKTVSILLVEQSQDSDSDTRNLVIWEIEESMKEISVQWEIPCDYLLWIELLQKLILESNDGIYRTVQRAKLPNVIEKNLDKYLIYDDKYYYITSEFFENMCNRMSYVTCSEMKKVLYDVGILVGEGKKRKYYEVHIPFLRNRGREITVRRIRLNRSWLDLPGGLAWHEMIDRRNFRNTGLLDGRSQPSQPEEAEVFMVIPEDSVM